MTGHIWLAKQTTQGHSDIQVHMYTFMSFLKNICFDFSETGSIWSAAWIIRHSLQSCVHCHWISIRHMGKLIQWHCCHSQLTLIIWVQLAADPPFVQSRGGRMPAPPKALLMSLHLESSWSETVHHRIRSRLSAANATPRENIIKHICAFATELTIWRFPKSQPFILFLLPKKERNWGSFNSESLQMAPTFIQINTDTEVFLDWKQDRLRLRYWNLMAFVSDIGNMHTME